MQFRPLTGNFLNVILEELYDFRSGSDKTSQGDVGAATSRNMEL